MPELLGVNAQHAAVVAHQQLAGVGAIGIRHLTPGGMAAGGAALDAHHLGAIGGAQPALAVVAFALLRWLVVAPHGCCLLDGGAGLGKEGRRPSPVRAGRPHWSGQIDLSGQGRQTFR